MGAACLLLAVLLGPAVSEAAAQSRLRSFLKDCDSIARKRHGIVLRCDYSVNDVDPSSTRQYKATIVGVAPATFRMDWGPNREPPECTYVASDRELRMYDHKRHTSLAISNHSRTPFFGHRDGFSPRERTIAWILFGHSQYMLDAYQMKITRETEWYVHVLCTAKDPDEDVRKIEFVFNRKWQVPARVWMQMPNRTQLQWLVKEFEFDKQLTVEKMLADLPEPERLPPPH